MRLLAASPDWEIGNPPLLDSTGIYFTPNLRHLDRGNDAPDRGQYDQPAYVIGGTGAACPVSPGDDPGHFDLR